MFCTFLFTASCKADHCCVTQGLFRGGKWWWHSRYNQSPCKQQHHVFLTSSDELSSWVDQTPATGELTILTSMIPCIQNSILVDFLDESWPHQATSKTAAAAAAISFSSSFSSAALCRSWHAVVPAAVPAAIIYKSTGPQVSTYPVSPLLSSPANQHHWSSTCGIASASCDSFTQQHIVQWPFPPLLLPLLQQPLVASSTPSVTLASLVELQPVSPLTPSTTFLSDENVNLNTPQPGGPSDEG